MNGAEQIVIAVDFDGTVVEHNYPRVGVAVPGAIDWLLKFQAAGAKLILWTMRSDDNVLMQAVEYLRSNGVELFGINSNPTQKDWTSSPKAYAHVYIDDAAYGCPLIPGTTNERPMVDWSIVGPAVYKEITK